MADDPDEGAGASDEPLAELAERIRQRRAGESERPGADADLDDLDRYFREEAYEELGSDELWEAIAEAPDDTAGVEAGEAPDEHIVPKRTYCEDCEHFSDPPEVHCTHAGTTILEYVDLEHVRVRNCPVVARRQALGQRERGRMTQMSFGSQRQE